PHREALEARRTPDSAADLDLVALVAEEQRALPLEHDEQLLLGAVAMRRPPDLAGRDHVMPHPGAHGADGAPEVADDELRAAARDVTALAVGEVHDPRRPRARIREVRRPGGELTLPRDRPRPRLHPCREEPAHARTRQV